MSEHRESKGLVPFVLDGCLVRRQENTAAIGCSDVPFWSVNLNQLLNQKIINTGSYQSAGTAIGMTIGMLTPLKQPEMEGCSMIILQLLMASTS